jgi:DNA-binding CsgD family transcriptional regulator/CRISPR/Cas system-associated protein endoribonuclease Cas2
MENSKPTYGQIEQELNEYKELLWQLMDEYKLNLGNAEKQLEAERAKFAEHENTKSETGGTSVPGFLPLLGLPACLFDKSGRICGHNNKFKFFVELLGFEIEDIEIFSDILKKSKNENLQERFKTYLAQDEGLMQCMFTIENQFQGIINIVLRVYYNEENKNYLAFFVELNKNDLVHLCTNSGSKNATKTPEVLNVTNQNQLEELRGLRSEIEIFTEKSELYEEILKSPEFSPENSEISKALLYSLKKIFNLENHRNKILEKLHTHFKSFVGNINRQYPELTSNEEKHCLLIKAGLTYKEIAAIMSVSINGVKIARNRLRKKFDLENETRTSEFIENIL